MLGLYRYSVLNGVDCVNKNATQMLKAVINYPQTLWVLTINDFTSIEAGVKYRYHRIAFNAPPAAIWFPTARRILAHAGCEWRI